MSRSSKRRPDRRQLHPTRTYSVQELMVELDKSEATILGWVREGNLAIDDKQPVLVFGWRIREWRIHKWSKRKKPLPSGQYYCSKCREARTLREGTCETRGEAAGKVIERGQCNVCGTRTIWKSVSSSAAASGKAGEMEEVNGFDDSPTCPTKPIEAPAGNVPLSKAKRSVAAPHLPRNAFNERLKRGFFEFTKHANGRDDKSLRLDELAMLRFEAFLQYRDLGSLASEEAIGFKQHLSATLSTAVIKANLTTVRRFHEWVIGEMPELRSGICNVQYLSLSRKEVRSTRSMERLVLTPTIDQIHAALMAMPVSSFVERRDRAMVTLLALAAIRVGTLVSLRVKHVDVDQLLVHQPAAEVATKFSKNNTSIMLVLRTEWLEIIREYLAELSAMRLSANDPLFPRCDPAGSQGFRSRRETREFLSGYQRIGHIVPEAFARIGAGRFTPHVFRHVHGKIAKSERANLSVLCAISQNLGHANIRTTGGYGQMGLSDRHDTITSFAEKVRSGEQGETPSEDDHELIKMFLAWRKSKKEE